MPRYLAKVSQLLAAELSSDADLSSVEYKILQDKDTVLFSSEYSISRTIVRDTTEVFNKWLLLMFCGYFFLV